MSIYINDYLILSICIIYLLINSIKHYTYISYIVLIKYAILYNTILTCLTICISLVIYIYSICKTIKFLNGIFHSDISDCYSMLS